MKENVIKCGDIYWAESMGTLGYEYLKKRPYLVIDSDAYLRISPVVCVVPLTSNTGNQNGYDIFIRRSEINGLKYDSIAKLDQIYAFDRGRLQQYVGFIGLDMMKSIHLNLRKHFNL